MHPFPEVPANLTEMSVDDLRQLRDDVRSAIRAAVDDTANLSSDVIAEAKTARGEVNRIDQELSRRELAEFSAEEDPETEETEGGEEEEDDTSTEASDGGTTEGGTETEPTTEEENEGEMSGTPPSTSLGTQSEPETTTPARRSHIVITDRTLVDGLAEGVDPDFDQLSAALVRKSQRVVNTPEKINVADITYDPYDEQKLTGDKGEMYTKLTQNLDEDLVAALCGPTDEIIALDNPMVDTARHVTTSLPRYVGDASKFSVHQAPTYTDIDWSMGEDNPEGAIGHWNSSHDDAYFDNPDTAATKGCLEVQCVDDVDFEIQAIFSCIQVPNLFAMSFPQLVSLYQRLGLAAHSQYADDLALEALKTADAITFQDGDGSSAPGYDAMVRVLRTLVRARADYINRERFTGINFDVWIPQAFASFFQAGLLSRRTDDGRIPNATVADVTAYFARYGFTVHWYQDPSFEISMDAGGGVYVERDYADITFRAAPRGKFRFIDKGRLTVGVMGSGGFRDSTLVASNRFRVFFETFETVIDTMSAPAVDLNFEGLCNNGVQIADSEIECLGLAS